MEELRPVRKATQCARGTGCSVLGETSREGVGPSRRRTSSGAVEAGRVWHYVARASVCVRSRLGCFPDPVRVVPHLCAMTRRFSALSEAHPDPRRGLWRDDEAPDGPECGRRPGERLPGGAGRALSKREKAEREGGWRLGKASPQDAACGSRAWRGAPHAGRTGALAVRGADGGSVVGDGCCSVAPAARRGEPR